jgi:pilus assembly protein CpaD
MLMNMKRRYFLQSGTRSVRHLCLAMGLVFLTACADRTTYWSPSISPKKNKVSWAEYHHPVNFSNTSTQMNKTEKKALSRFLGRVGRGHGVSVMLATGSSTLAKRRETSLARHLIGRGYSVSRIPARKSHSVRANSVRVTVGRYIVTPPACPDWSKEATGDPANRSTSNFRCATETNLGLMVANPEALIRGTQIGPADGEAITVGIESYRKGEIEKPAATSARELAGGGGGAK